MRVNKGCGIKCFLAILFVLSFVSVLYAGDTTRFTLKDGVIDDSEIVRQWAPAPDQPMNYYQAEAYAKKLSISGGGWRLPTRDELKSLYDPSMPGGADPMFHVNSKFAWASELKNPSSAWCFLFFNGIESSFPLTNSPGLARALAVRSKQ